MLIKNEILAQPGATTTTNHSPNARSQYQSDDSSSAATATAATITTTTTTAPSQTGRHTNCRLDRQIRASPSSSLSSSSSSSSSFSSPSASSASLSSLPTPSFVASDSGSAALPNSHDNRHTDADGGDATQTIRASVPERTGPKGDQVKRQQQPVTLADSCDKTNGCRTTMTAATATINDCQSEHSADDDEKDFITIIHFNDCYNIEPGPESSGAAGFLTAINQFRHLNPIILFSGDILSPSFMSTFTKGEQMIPVLNDIGVHCAVFGNHEFDYGVDNLIEFTRRTTFPWLLSNVIDKETSNQLGDGLVYHIIERHGLRVGLIGLIEEEWLSTLSTLDSSDVIYEDFVEKGRELARWLKSDSSHKVDYVIALTHFRTPNDIRLADSVPEIDLILGGHDHDYEIIKRPNCYVIKSGTDFREFSLIKLKKSAQYFQTKKRVMDAKGEETAAKAKTSLSSSTGTITGRVPSPTSGQQQYHDTSEPAKKPISDIAIKRIECQSFPPDENLKQKLDKFVTSVDEKMGKVLGQFNCDLDGRFSSIRKYETNLGNFVCDIMLASTHADLAILNSGTLRSDRIHPKGDFTMRDLFNILGYIDPIAVLQATGYHVWQALENGISQWPKLEGRFPQVSGCSFVFDPTKPPLKRIDPKDILIGEEPIDLNKHYKLTTKAYLASGKDGYDILKECKILVPGDESPDLTTSILNHFEAINILKSNRRTHHRQSLICLSRSSIKKLLDQTTTDGDDDENNVQQHDQSGGGKQTNINKTRQAPHNDDNNNHNHGNNSTATPMATSLLVAAPAGSSRLECSTIDERLLGSSLSLDRGDDDGLDEREAKGPSASSPLVGMTAPTPTLGSMLQAGVNAQNMSGSCGGCGNAIATPPSTIPRREMRQPRTKRMMSLYEMECEQCKLEPKVEGRIKIMGVNYWP